MQAADFSKSDVQKREEEGRAGWLGGTAAAE